MKVALRFVPIAAAVAYTVLAYAFGGRPSDGWFVAGAFVVVFASVYGSVVLSSKYDQPESVKAY
jgi:hypothetical protein